MLILDIPSKDIWDEKTETFIMVPDIHIEMEHSLKSIFDWEAIWRTPFLHTKLTHEQLKSYLKCMVVNNAPDNFVDFLAAEDYSKIEKYISTPQTATWFSDPATTKAKGKGKNSIITAELVYYWMSALQIPFECDRWFIDRLFVLIRIAGEENQPPKKMSKKDMLKQRDAINMARRAKYNSQG